MLCGCSMVQANVEFVDTIINDRLCRALSEFSTTKDDQTHSLSDNR